MSKENNKKILIVDDDPQIVKALSDHLAREGYLVETAINGEDGLKKAKAFHPDLMLLDIIMPKMDGITMLKLVREDPAMSSIPAIVLTNLQTEEGVARSIEAGSTTYLIKVDYSLAELSDVIKKTLNIL
ncbi:MAG: response regulator [Candidatus Niyogibacteria bacterium]|nr:response regulator [Candidatus Niyogibacteria bacterium]